MVRKKFAKFGLAKSCTSFLFTLSLCESVFWHSFEKSYRQGCRTWTRFETILPKINSFQSICWKRYLFFDPWAIVLFVCYCFCLFFILLFHLPAKMVSQYERECVVCVRFWVVCFIRLPSSFTFQVDTKKSSDYYAYLIFGRYHPFIQRIWM